MWNWIRRRTTSPVTPPGPTAAPAPSAVARGRVKAGPYRLLHDYLRDRFADTVVLTFDQIEDLIGLALPSEARSDAGWWSLPPAVPTDAHWSDAWVLASRTARANLQAKTVIFDRVG